MNIDITQNQMEKFSCKPLCVFWVRSKSKLDPESGSGSLPNVEVTQKLRFFMKLVAPDGFGQRNKY